MKAFFQVFCLILICSVAVAGNCAESYRAHFEVNFEDGAAKGTISTPSDVVSGVPLTFEMGVHSLSLVFSVEPPPSDEYSLSVSLISKEKSKHDLNTPLLTQSTDASSISLLRQTFHSRLVGGKNGPLEFELEQNGCKINGVVALSWLR